MKSSELLKYQAIDVAKGGGGGGNVSTLRVKAELNETTGASTLDKTWNEIKIAITEGAGAYIYSDESYDEIIDIQVFTIEDVYMEDGTYEIYAHGIEVRVYATDDPDGYPATSGEPEPGPEPMS